MENYIVSARKYRPTTFESVVGQSSLTQTLRNAITTNHLAQAYLFCGPRGVGKTTCARIFAKTINCLNPTADKEACNECESCKAFNEQRSFNIHELDAASNNSVDNIRTLIEQVRIPPQVGKYSVFIIDEVHMLSKDAFNALLKTLEEPPSYAIFILATTEKNKVIPTILSRCQVYDFSRITVNDIVLHLQNIAAKEGVTASPEALNVVAQKADGGMRDALSIFDQLVSYCGSEITYERAIEILNVLDAEYYFKVVRSALQGNVSEVLLLFNEILVKGFDAQNFIVGLGSHLRNVLVSKDAATTKLLEVSDSVRQGYEEQARTCSVNFLFKALDIINDCDVAYRTSKNKRLTVELALIKICRLMMPQETVAPVAPVQPKAAPTQSPTSVPQTPTPAPTAAKPVAQAPTSQPTSQATQSVTQSVEKASNTTVTTQPAATPSFAPKSPSHISIRATIQSTQSDTVGPSSGQAKTLREKPFSAADFEKAWLELPVLFNEEDRVKAMLINAQCELRGNTVEVVLANASQGELFSTWKQKITANLADALQNDKISLGMRIDEHVSTATMTTVERYQHMVERNHELETLKNTLEMQLE